MNELETKPSKRNPFTVPEGYFEQLEQDIHRRTSIPERGAFRFEPAILKLAGVAAMVAFMAYLFMPEPTSGSPEDLLASVNTEHLEAYLAEYAGPEAEDILLPGSLNDETELNAYFETDTLF